MKLRMLYFGIVREKLGRREEIRDCPDGITVAGLLAKLSDSDRIFSLGAGVLRVAVNREYVAESHPLADNDEVAIIPPVAGGANLDHKNTPRCGEHSHNDEDRAKSGDAESRAKRRGARDGAGVRARDSAAAVAVGCGGEDLACANARVVPRDNDKSLRNTKAQ